MITPMLLARLAATVLVAGPLLTNDAAATLVRKSDGRAVGAAEGGVDLGVPSGRVRVQCWQDGHKILDEAGLGVLALGVPSQMNALRLRRYGKGSDGDVWSVISQARSTCLLIRP